MGECPTGWRSTSIGEVLTLQRGFDITKADQTQGDVPVISSGGVSSYHNVAMTKGPGVVLGRKGTLGRTYYVTSDYWPHDTTLWVRDFKGNNPRFVYYFFSTLDFRYLDVGSANPTLNRNHVHPIRIVWPPLTEQRSIAEVLGALDDKIEANQSLRALARTLGMALFRRELGEGTHYRPVGEMCASISRGVAPRYTKEDDGVRVLNQKCIRDGWISLSPSRWMREVNVQTGRLAKPGDVLVNSTGVGTLGRVARWLGPGLIHVDGHVTIARPDNTKCPSTVFSYGMLNAQADIEALGEGSTGQTELNRSRLAHLAISLPSRSNVDVLDQTLDSLDQCAQRHSDESECLSALRDTLLPKLMSGELRVRDAEELIEEAV